MAMLSPSLPLRVMGCPAVGCPAGVQNRLRASWKALLGSFVAGALTVSAVVALAGAAPRESSADAAREAAAAEWAAFVREQSPRELPPEWRWQIKTLRLDGMYGKRR